MYVKNVVRERKKKRNIERESERKKQRITEHR
jgi:hypothetical protein